MHHSTTFVLYYSLTRIIIFFIVYKISFRAIRKFVRNRVSIFKKIKIMHFFLLNIIHKRKTVFSEKISMFEIENLLQ